jgi:cation diffusion facilitator CzcD-associated flavoprotein CzcO
LPLEEKFKMPMQTFYFAIISKFRRMTSLHYLKTIGGGSMNSAREGLSLLEEKIIEDLQILDYPVRDWVKSATTSNGEHIYDVIIEGGGQSGLALCFALIREKVHNILVLDREREDFEGPWRSFARMDTLRTPKSLAGPNYGIPSLSISSWYIAQNGKEAWEELEYIPKDSWADYLHWFRSFLKLPVKNETLVKLIHWDEENQCFKIDIKNTPSDKTLYAKKVVLANGIAGAGEWVIPGFISKNVPKELYSHTHEDIDFTKFYGKRIGILGAGASAFDNAIIALEHKAKKVQQFFRRPELVKVNAYRWAEFVGFLRHHSDIPDADKWRFIHKIIEMGQLPPRNTYQKAITFKEYSLHPSSPWNKVEEKNGYVEVETPQGKYTFDHLIIGTGFVTNLHLRPELKNFVDDIVLWKDRYTPPEKMQSRDLENHPYLGKGFQFLEKEEGTAPYLNSLFNYNFGGLLSNGFGGASISGMKYSIQRIVAEITSQLYSDNLDEYFHDLENFNIEEF